MQMISDIMTPGVYTLTPENTLQDAETLMREHKVRHLPVVDADKKVLGVLSQKEFLREAFRITDKFGAHHLQDYLAKTPVGDCLDTEVSKATVDVPLKAAGEQLRLEKHGCLLITTGDNALLGIVTSQDFVKLALSLL